MVDDDPQTLRHVRDPLVEAGYAPLATGDPQELPGLVKSHKPHLVLLDLLLPGTDGIELMARVPELADLPVIFLSAYGRDETIVKALDAGAADYIVKPFSPTELTARVRAALRRRADPEPFRSGRAGHPLLRRAAGHPGRPPAGVDAHRVRAAARALAQRGTGGGLRHPGPSSLGRAACRLARPATRARRRAEAPPQVG